MSDHLIRRMVDELVGEDAPHLGHAIAMAIGFNLRKIPRKIFLWLRERLLWITFPTIYPRQNELL